MSTAKKSHLGHIKGNGSTTMKHVKAVALDKPPNAPRNLNDVGQKYWREYTRAMIAASMLFESDLATLEDLCYWESLKHRGRDEIPNDSLFLQYTNEETGRISHTQPHAAFSNLKAIQSTIMALRGKLGLTISDRSGLKVAQRGGEMKPLKGSKDW